MNVLLMTWHDLGRHLGCYGWESVNSPNLDRLAAQGVCFERMFCTSPGCSPSRACMMTGRYPHSNGVLGLVHRGWRLDPGERTLAHHLAAAGYTTALCGLQHEHHPTSPGQAEEELRDTLGYQTLLSIHNTRAAAVAPAAIEFIQQQAGSGQPFFLNVGFGEVHRPNHRPDLGEPTAEQCAAVELPAYMPDTPETRRDMAEFEIMIEHADAQAGRVLAALDSNGLADDTLIIFITDHGCEFNRAKMTLYDPGIEIACLMRHPGRIPGGRRIHGLASNVDILPTVLDLVGLPMPDQLHGHSLVPALTTDAGTGRHIVYAEKTWHVSYDPCRCVRNDRYKLIWHQLAPEPIQPSPAHSLIMGLELAARTYGVPRSEFELYDLQEDPGETRNLAANPDYVDVLAELDSSLRQEMETTDDPLLEDEVLPHEQHPPLHTWSRQDDGSYTLSINNPERFLRR